MKHEYFFIFLAVILVVIGLATYADTANNRYQSNPFNTNDTLNDMANGITFGTNTKGKAGNLDGCFVSHTFNTANVNYTIKHTLGRKPTGAWVVYSDNHSIVYDLTGDRLGWDGDDIVLATDFAPANSVIFIF